MAQIDLVIWLPRSREGAPGQYQERLWCSYEAAMVQIRGVPVALAGYGLSSRQRALAAWGSMLVLPPWAAHLGDVELTHLGQANFLFLCFVCAFPFDYFMWWGFYDGIGVTTLLLWCFALLIGAIYLIIVRQSESVARARHGKQVLRIMYTAAAGGSARFKKVDLRTSLFDNLPWLPGFDRRDAITVAQLLDFFDDRTTNVSLDALALSMFTNARLRHSPGDDPSASSVRSWLDAAGISMFAHGQYQKVLSSHEHSLPLPATEADWLDRKHDPSVPLEVPCAMVSATTTTSSAGAKSAAQVAASDSSTGGREIEVEMESDDLFLGELYDNHWRVSRGLGGTFCATPAGGFWLRWPLTRDAATGEERCSLAWEDGARQPQFDWLRYGYCFYLLQIINELAWGIVVLLHALDPSPSGGRMPLRVYASYLNHFIIGLALGLGLMLPQVRAFTRNMHTNRRAMPIRVTGRLEYAFAFILCAFIQLAFGGASETDMFVDWFSSATYYVRVFPTVASPLLDTAIAAVHSFAAAHTFRDPRFLFELTSGPMNRRVKVW